MISVSRGPDASPTGTLSLVEAYATHGPTGQAAYILTGSGAKRKLSGMVRDGGNDNQGPGEILQRGCPGRARVRCVRPRQMAAPDGAWVADRPLRRLFRGDANCLPRLAPAFRGRRSPHGDRRTAGGPASFHTGSNA